MEKYDHEERRAHVREADLDYYTDTITYTKVKILDRFETAPAKGAVKNHGEVHVSSQVVGFKKIKFWTNENVGAGELQMPEDQMPPYSLCAEISGRARLHSRLIRRIAYTDCSVWIWP